jgi:hypothetical protein
MVEGAPPILFPANQKRGLSTNPHVVLSYSLLLAWEKSLQENTNSVEFIDKSSADRSNDTPVMQLSKRFCLIESNVNTDVVDPNPIRDQATAVSNR